MNEESGSPSSKTVLQEVAMIVPILVIAGVLLVLLAQTAASSPGDFTVVALEPGNTTVGEYGTVNVSATIRNTGDITDTQQVRITLGQAETIRSVTLEPGESETIWLRGVEAKSLGIGNATYRIRTGDETQSATLTVDSDRPPKFNVSALQPTAATVGTNDSQTTVSARIENVGGQRAEAVVKFQIGNETYFTEVMALDPGESERIDATFDLRWLEPGTHTFTITTANDSLRGSFNVPEPATLELRDIEAGDGSHHVDGSVTVSLRVENTGDLAANETVELVVAGETLRRETVVLESGESTRVVFDDIDLGRLGIGVHQYHLWIGDATATGTWVIEGDGPASFEVSSLEPQSITVEEDGSIDIVATIENTGEQTGTQTVELRFNGETRYEETVELRPGERMTFAVNNLSLAGISPGEYEYSVVTADAGQTGHVQIEPGPNTGQEAVGDSGGDDLVTGETGGDAQTGDGSNQTTDDSSGDEQEGEDSDGADQTTAGSGGEDQDGGDSTEGTTTTEESGGDDQDGGDTDGEEHDGGDTDDDEDDGDGEEEEDDDDEDDDDDEKGKNGKGKGQGQGQG